MIMFRTAFAKQVVRFGDTNFNLGYGEGSVPIFKWVAVICGVAFLAFGLRRFM